MFYELSALNPSPSQTAPRSFALCGAREFGHSLAFGSKLSELFGRAHLVIVSYMIRVQLEAGRNGSRATRIFFTVPGPSLPRSCATTCLHWRKLVRAGNPSVGQPSETCLDPLKTQFRVPRTRGNECTTARRSVTLLLREARSRPPAPAPKHPRVGSGPFSFGVESAVPILAGPPVFSCPHQPDDHPQRER